ncbi:MAG: hypothetical protein BWY52_02304 [Chloroflexi bacterium ADurb.Bin325]|nr:MAG: hypothetical protein BWY52_02304 [Chloroflexi bacterium ADurb.Bin325]
MTVRRSLYAAALAGLLLFLAGLLLAVHGVAGGWAGGVELADLPAALIANIPWLALLVIGAAVFGVAWGMTNRAARPLTLAAAAERGQPARKALLYTGQLLLLAASAAFAVLALRGALLQAFALLGLGPDDPRPGWPIAQAAAALLALLAWGYLRYETVRDGDVGREQAVFWRRAYTYLAATGGLILSVGGLGEFIRSVIALGIQPLAPAAPWRAPMAGAAAAFAVEMNALGRVLLRYAALLAGALVTLLALGYLIDDVILLILGQRAGRWWGHALAYFPAMLGMWLVFSSGIQGDRARSAESLRTARIRRIVRYTITALALAAFWLGLTEVVQLVLQMALARQAGGALDTVWRGRFALATALVLVGAPGWWGHWWPLHVRARLNTPGGHNERASGIRRVYLFAVVLLGAAVLVFSLGFGVFLGLNLDAATTVSGVLAALAGAIAGAAVALLWAVSHALILRGDERLLARDAAEAERQHAFAPPVAVAPPPITEPAAIADAEPIAATAPLRYRREDLPALPPPAADDSAAGEEGAADDEGGAAEAEPAAVAAELADTVAVVDGANGVAGAALIAGLRRALPDLAIRPVGLNAVAQGEMLAALGAGTDAAPPAAAALATAALILGPADIVTPGGMDGEVTAEIFAAIDASPAAVLLLPPRDTRLQWVAAPEWTLAQWVDHAVIEVQQALGLPRPEPADAEELTQGRQPQG